MGELLRKFYAMDCIFKVSALKHGKKPDLLVGVDICISNSSFFFALSPPGAHGGPEHHL